MGVAGPKPSDAGEEATSPSRAKPGSGREPTWVGSCRDSACALKTGWASQGRSRAKQGWVQPPPAPGRSPGLSRAGSPLGWGPAQGQPALPKARQAARVSQGRSLALQGEGAASPRRSPGWAGSPPGWVLPRFSLHCRRRTMLYGRRQAEVEQCRGGCSLSQLGKAQVGKGAHSGGVLPQLSLGCRRRPRLHGRCRAEA